jgi:hypothetical protein
MMAKLWKVKDTDDVEHTVKAESSMLSDGFLVFSTNGKIEVMFNQNAVKWVKLGDSVESDVPTV